ncbi:MAG: hypothetical protein QOF67_2986 [Mycobacterium sp.]|nr:hypothetical protein [Mycobacterium sp.]
MDAETSWRVIEQERLSLAALLANLTDDQWNAPSLCGGWRVKDVAAHVAMTPQPPTLRAVAGELVRARGSFVNATRDLAVRFAERPGADLVAEIRQHAASRRLPKVTNYRNIVLDILVHGQDIAIPLGIPREMPKAAAVAGVERARMIGWLLGVKRSVKRFRFVATDVDWAAGDGPEVRGPVSALLLLLTGRPAALPQLSGPGVEQLSGLVRR